MEKQNLFRVRQLIQHITCSVFGTMFTLKASYDDLHDNGRVYLQIAYDAPCTKTGKIEPWKGRKWTLSEFMTDDEIVKTAYAAFEAAVIHEVMEGFKFDDIIVFNPHVDFRALLDISHKEIKRE